MKKNILICVLTIIALMAAACGGRKTEQINDSKEYDDSSMESTVEESSVTESTTVEIIEKEKNTDYTTDDKKIKIITPDGDIVIRLENNSASDDLLNYLPMTVNFEDFNNTEKISYIDGKLDTSNAVTEYTPLAGAFAYYIPWGNFSVFYEDFRQSSGLVSLGTVESGMEYVKTLDNYGTVTIERLGD